MDTRSIFSIKDSQTFEDIALTVFNYQYRQVAVYKRYIDMLKINVKKINTFSQIPFLPISFFKTHQILSAEKQANLFFTSSGTTGKATSTHFVADATLYEDSFTNCFEQFVGKVSDYTFLALLPSYLERSNSSLVYMVESLIKQSGKPHSGFYLHNFQELYLQLNKLKEAGEKTILFGVSFALLDFVEQYQIEFPDLMVFETGGMKGHRRELSREELHARLQNGFGVNNIYSEYGMTELLSQAYCTDGRFFKCPNWMKIVLRDPQDPLSILPFGTEQKGGINVVDLANYYSCSFIATQDMGKYHQNGYFEVLGRFDDADIRGCNMLYE